MVRTMAHSPALLDRYLNLSGAMKRAKLHRRLGEKVSLAIQEHLGCGYCLAAHTDVARSLGLSEREIELARQATADDPKEAALLFFAVRVLVEPASLTDADIAELARQGFSDRLLADVVGLVARNLLTGAFDLVAGLVDSSPSESAAAVGAA